jgi:ribonuclease P protein component
MKFSRSQHLRKNADFEAIRADSEGATSALFRMRIRISDTGLRRLGVISSRRIGGAVERNRARRLLREAFRNAQNILPPSCDVLLIASRDLPDTNGNAVQAVFQTQAAKILRRLKPDDHAATGK